MKKLALILILLFLIEVVVLLEIARAFRLWSGQSKPKAITFDNIFSREALVKNLPTNLKLTLDGKSLISSQIDPKSLSLANSAIWEPKGDSSFSNYFFVQTGTLHPWSDYDFFAKVKGLAIDEQYLGGYLVNLAQKENRPSKDAKLVIENNIAFDFVPHQTGQILDLALTRKLVKQAATSNTLELELPLVSTPPRITLGDLNNLGIKELLARGQSDFSGSSHSRIQNIRTGASRYRGLIIKAGEEFSFNKHLGPIDAAHGFLPELVIKPEGTIPEFGGGLCQVSSTAFRAAFFAGLPITERRNHSYAVRYYEWISDDLPRAVGLDATIYPGAQDMEFVNDTPGAILIWISIEGNRLYFDFYGTNDQRKIIVDGPHPYDRQPSGAVKSTVGRKVIYESGEVKELRFQSNYVSPNLYPKIVEYPPPLAPTSTPTNL